MECCGFLFVLFLFLYVCKTFFSFLLHMIYGRGEIMKCSILVKKKSTHTHTVDEWISTTLSWLNNRKMANSFLDYRVSVPLSLSRPLVVVPSPLSLPNTHTNTLNATVVHNFIFAMLHQVTFFYYYEQSRYVSWRQFFSRCFRQIHRTDLIFI